MRKIKDFGKNYLNMSGKLFYYLRTALETEIRFPLSRIWLFLWATTFMEICWNLKCREYDLLLLVLLLSGVMYHLHCNISLISIQNKDDFRLQWSMHINRFTIPFLFCILQVVEQLCYKPGLFYRSRKSHWVLWNK